MAYCKHTHLWMALDPVHIGTGGYRLGRVDNSITREPGTNLPKIPGTSLSGAARSYAAMRNENPNCAGQGGHCTEPDCPVCYTFGSLKVKKDGEPIKAYAGTVNIFDAHILFFPVHSMAGPVWVTSLERLGLHKKLESNVNELPSDKIALGSDIDAPKNHLNLGWLLLDAIDTKEFTLTLPEEWSKAKEWKAIENRLVLVSDRLFGQIVNDNLEVRTSVSIDPLTGAAEEGALFTYEAIPRSSFLVSDLVQDDYRQDDFLEEKAKAKGLGDSPLGVVGAGFKMIEHLGVGGMGTRGFGRMRLVGDPAEEAQQ